MIKKVARIEAPLETVKSVFAGVRSWPQWMPGIQAVKILKESDDYLLAELKQLQMGRRTTQEMEFRFQAQGMHQRQVSGWFKHWEADWRFLQPPDKKGTTVSFAVQFDMGIFGFFISSRTIQQTVDRVFDEMMANVVRQLRSLGAEGEFSPGAGSGEETVLEVFQTSTGLEVWIDGKKYVLKAAEGQSP